MPLGLSLHIGVNHCNPKHYAGWEKPLEFCEADAESLHTLCQKEGFEAQMLKSAQATRSAVIDGIRAAAEKLNDGDIFLLSYAGHGGQVRDANQDEEDYTDETWCLYDGQLIDDELGALWQEFNPRVRIVVLSDSCHSGTVTRSESQILNALDKETLINYYGDENPSFRYMPRDFAMETYGENMAFYDDLQKAISPKHYDEGPCVLLISGCQDNQLSGEAWGHGLFTAALLDIWNDGEFLGSYQALHTKILSVMPPVQQPAFFVTGVQNDAFVNQTPFSI